MYKTRSFYIHLCFQATELHLLLPQGILVSDHNAIFLEWNGEQEAKELPFKFNQVWLQDKYLVDLIKISWMRPLGIMKNKMMYQVTQKLHRLKSKVKTCIIKCKKTLSREFSIIDKEISELMDPTSPNFVSEQSKNTILELSKLSGRGMETKNKNDAGF